MTLGKQFFFHFSMILMLATCRPQPKDVVEPTKNTKTTSEAKAKVPEVPAPVSEPIDISGVPVESHQIAKTNPSDLIQYRFASGNCASSEDTTKIYGTYSDNVSVPISVSGSCSMEFRACSAPDTCSDWKPINFTQAATPPEADKMRILLRQQFEDEQQLHAIGQAISQNMADAAPLFDQCLANQKDVNIQALKDFAALTPQQLDALLQYDLSQQVTDALNKASSAKMSTPIASSLGKNTENPPISSAESTRVAIFQNLALLGVPVIIIISIESGFEAFEIFKWSQYLKQQRVALIGDKSVQLVRHASGFLVDPVYKNTPIENLSRDKVYLDDPVTKIVIGTHSGTGAQHVVTPTPVSEFFDAVRNAGGTVVLNKEKALWTIDGKPLYFKRNFSAGGVIEVQGGKVLLDDFVHETKGGNPTDSFYKNHQVPPVNRQNVKNQIKIARPEYDSHSGSKMKEKFGQTARVFVIGAGVLSVSAGLARLYTAYGLAEDGSDPCAMMLNRIKAVQDNIAKANPIKADLFQTKLAIQTQL